MKNKNQYTKYHWDNYIYKLASPSFLSKTLIVKSVNDLWLNKIDKITDNQHVIALFRAQSSNGNYFTLGRLRRLNKCDKEYWINIIADTLSLKSNDYIEDLIIKIVIGYGIREGLAPLVNKNIIKPNNNYLNYKHYKLPLTMDPFKYGNNAVVVNKSLYIVPISNLTIAKISVKYNKDNKKVNRVAIFKNGNQVLSYKDKMISENKIERLIGSNQYIYTKEANTYTLDLFTVCKPTRKIEFKKEDKKLDSKIITMDIETFNNNGKLIPYLISWYNEDHGAKSYFLTDFENNHETMIKTAITDLMKVKFNGYNVYLHNFAKFDSIFLLNFLNKLGQINLTINKGRIISLTLSYIKKDNNKSYSLHFKDSIQLLLTSLRKLAKTFNVETQKGIFPHTFVRKDNLDYIGAVPSIDYFSDLSEYKAYSSNFGNNWSLREESIKYCKADCISLYQIIVKFNAQIFDLYKINVNKYPTLPSLAFALFRTHYMKKIFIPMISGQIAKNIRLSYTGGSTDMFIPSNSGKNELVYCYDINSLFPSAMADYPMPIGKPTYFEGDIRKYKPDAFGFFYCRVTTPKNLEHPILQTHVKTKGGVRTVAALGTYEDMLFSAEIDNAMKLGYKFDILWGYTFEKGYIFKDFVNKLYNFRLLYSKDNPMNYIHKIIMNSLYGRFGMDDSFKSSIIINKEDYPNFEKVNYGRILDITSLDNSLLIELESDDTNTMLDNGSETHNVNVAIASAITAYARIIMSQFKNNAKLKLFYTDTDSIHTNLSPTKMNKLYPGIIDNKSLGKLKIEHIAEKAYYIAPKVYYLKTIENKVIIKVKGLSKIDSLNDKDFKKLLIRNNSIIKSQDKWYKSFEDSTILIKNQLYTIQQTDNKRQLIYNMSNKLIASKPYYIDINKEIS